MARSGIFAAVTPRPTPTDGAPAALAAPAAVGAAARAPRATDLRGDTGS